MKILILQLDGKIPNLALMRISAHFKSEGAEVMFRQAGNERALQPELFDNGEFDQVFASAIFEKTRPLIDHLMQIYPKAIVAGSGSYNKKKRLDSIGITSRAADWSLYPRFKNSIGFTQRGCRLKCQFCGVPDMEGSVYEESIIAEIWRGDPYPKNILLLDNDFFGQTVWRDRIAEIRDGGFKVSFNQGINARMLTDETAEAISSVKFSDDNFVRRRIYTAWDNLGDSRRLFAGLRSLVKYGIKPDEIMVYMLIGFWPGETHDDRERRRKALRKFGCRPYPMPWTRTTELARYQTWVIGAYDKRVTWEQWVRANYQPRNLKIDIDQYPELF